MATYAIGDVQGCFEPLQALLKKINFNVMRDQLWFVGDLVNRGPDSLSVLRFIKNLPNVKVVLGNHDFHLLALASGLQHPHHTLHDALSAPDLLEIVEWLRHLPLIYHDEKLNAVMSHAGIYPGWDLHQAKQYAAEVSTALQQENWQSLLPQLYGNQPAKWSDDLQGDDRLRFIVNAFTRMRFCSVTGELELQTTENAANNPPGYLPWFQLPRRYPQTLKVIFGHWAALRGVTEQENIFALDTGCVWGNCLTAMRLEDKEIFSTACK